MDRWLGTILLIDFEAGSARGNKGIRGLAVHLGQGEYPSRVLLLA